MSEAQPVLELSDVSVPPAGERLSGLSHIDWHVRPGGLVCIGNDLHTECVSLFDVAEGLVEPAEGAVRFLGADWRRMGNREQCRQRGLIGRVFPGEGWVSNLTMYENMALAARQWGSLPEADLQRELLALCERVGVRDLLAERPHGLGRRESRRAQWVRAFFGARPLVLVELGAEDLQGMDLSPLAALAHEACAGGAAVIWLAPDAPQRAQRGELRATACYELRDGRLTPAAGG